SLAHGPAHDHGRMIRRRPGVQKPVTVFPAQAVIRPALPDCFEMQLPLRHGFLLLKRDDNRRDSWTGLGNTVSGTGRGTRDIVAANTALASWPESFLASFSCRAMMSFQALLARLDDLRSSGLFPHSR